MGGRRSGRIVNIACAAGRWESPNPAACNTSKHAVVGMTRCAALENAALGVNVNTICPSFVETDMIAALKEHADAVGVAFEELIAAAKSRVPMGPGSASRRKLPTSRCIGAVANPTA